MAEPTDIEVMQPRQHRSSKLRNEVHQNSTDDEQAPDQSDVQVPDSDFFVPETQLETVDEENPSFSPSSRLTLENAAISKTRTVEEPSPLVYGLTKPTLQSDKETSSQFKFTPARLPVSKAAPKKEVTASKAVPEPAAVDVVSQSMTEVSANAVPTDQPQHEAKTPGVKEHTKRKGQEFRDSSKLVAVQKEQRVVSQSVGDYPHAENEVTEPAPPESYRTMPPRPEQSGTVSDTQLEADPAILPSAHIGPSAATDGKRLRSVAKKGKKGKKSRKAQLAQHLNGPWPPRSLQIRREVASVESLNNEHPVLDVIPHETAEYLAVDHQIKNISPKDLNGLPVITQGDVSVDQEQHNSRNVEEQVGATQVGDPSTQDKFLSPTSREQDILPADSQYSLTVNNEQQNMDTPEEHLAWPTETPDAVDDTDGPACDMFMKSHAHNNIEHVPPGRSVLFTKNKVVDGPLHEVSSGAGPSRVRKPQKKKRNAPALRPAAVIPTIENGDGFPQAFDHVLGGLRMVIHAERDRVHSDYLSGMNARQDNIATLKHVISLQKTTIQGLKDSDATMHAAVGRQTDTVQKLKKYVKGLEIDHAKIKASVKSYHDECDKSWKERVGEVTAEKAELEQEFSAMIYAVNKSRKSMKTAMVECCHRLELSEYKRTTLVQDLKMQHALLESEKQKTTCLEQQIVSSLQVIHNHLENNIGVVVQKLGSIQSTVEDTSEDGKRDTCLRECVEALKGLREIPFMTAKDTQKAEGMLRSLHETIDSKLGSLSRSMNAKKFSSKDVENYISDQLQNLRAEILKYHEVSIECEKARQTNDHLNKQLQAQKEHQKNLDGRVKSLLQSEASLTSRASQLELELNILKNTHCDRNSEPSILEQEAVALRSQLRKAEDDLQVAVDKLSDVEAIRQEEESETVGWKKLAEDNQTKFDEVAKRMKKHKRDQESLVDMRARIEKECRKVIEGKVAGWENDLHRVTCEKDEKEKVLKEAIHELDGTRIQLQRVQQQLRSVESEVKSLRKDKTTVESKFKKAQCTIDESSNALSELATLTGKIEEKDSAFRVIEQELNTLGQEYANLRGQTTALHESVGLLEAQLAEHKSTIELERKKVSAQLSESRRKEEIALQEVQNQITTFKQEKQSLESSLEGSRSNESLLKDTQSRTSYELEGLRVELVELGNAKQAIEQEAQWTRKAVDGELETLRAEHRNEIGELQRRLAQADAALKESEVKIYEKEQELETHKKVTEQKIKQKLANEHNQKLGLQEFLQVKLHQQPTTTRSTPATNLNSTNSENPRRKVNRRTSSVADVEQLSHNQTHHTLGSVKSGEVVYRGAELPDLFESVDASMADDLGTQERLGHDGVSILEPVPETVPETQVQGPLAFKDFNRTMEQDPQNKAGSTSSISELSSDLVDELFHTRVSTPTDSQRMAVSRASTDLSIKATSYQTPRRFVDDSIHDPQSCDRPKSQANTASRMKPPPPPPSQRPRLDRDSQERTFATKPVRSQHSSSHRTSKTSSHGPSSPDYIRRHLSTAKMTYGHHAGKSTTFSGSRSDVVSQGSDHSSSQKRKSPANHAESDTSSKKYRLSQSISPLSMPRSLPRDYESRTPDFPGVSQRSQDLRRTSSQAMVTGSIPRSSRLSRTKTAGRDHRYETRFAEELRR